MLLSLRLSLLHPLHLHKLVRTTVLLLYHLFLHHFLTYLFLHHHLKVKCRYQYHLKVKCQYLQHCSPLHLLVLLFLHLLLHVHLSLSLLSILNRQYTLLLLLRLLLLHHHHHQLHLLMFLLTPSPILFILIPPLHSQRPQYWFLSPSHMTLAREDTSINCIHNMQGTTQHKSTHLGPTLHPFSLLMLPVSLLGQLVLDQVHL